MRDRFLTAGGTELEIQLAGMAQVANTDSIGVAAEVTTPARVRRVRVELDALVSFEGLSAPTFADQDVDGHPRETLAILAIVDRVDTDPGFSAERSFLRIPVRFDDAERLKRRPPMGDRELRRYIARRVYFTYRRSTMDATVAFGRIDQLITGCDAMDFERNTGLLMAEGYLSGRARAMGSSVVQPTADLVRSVERYGAAKDDVVAERDYPATLEPWPVLAALRDQILLEWARFSVATTGAELSSVFRAIAPLVEAALARTLATHDSTKANATLGPMVGDLVSRKLGNRGLWSRLNHVITFARDLAEHGEALSEPALRIACENAFDLIPQIAALAK